jgi:hypothetical protein
MISDLKTLVNLKQSKQPFAETELLKKEKNVIVEEKRNARRIHVVR